MKLKFKTQAYQTAAVQAVVDCFKGQVPHHGGTRYRLDPGDQKAAPASPQAALVPRATSPEAAAEKEAAFRNADLTLSDQALLSNIQDVQRQQNLLVSASLSRSEEHTSELQSRGHLVCRLLLEKKKLRSPHGQDQSCYRRR